MGANTNTMPGTAMPGAFDPASVGGRPGMAVTPMPVGTTGGTSGFANLSNPGQPISGVMSSRPPPGYGGFGPAINNMNGGGQTGGCPTCGR